MHSNHLLRTLILSISFMGIAIAVVGIVAYFFKALLAQHVHYILAIPPIGVASYVFVFSLCNKSEGNLPDTVSSVLRELVWASAVSAVVFFLCSILIIALLNITKDIF